MKRIVIVGAGFAGLAAAKALRHSDAEVFVVDRANHNLFQPLLLVMATGVTHSYFGHDEFSEFAPGLKGLADAVRIRNKVLQAFEQAEAEQDPSRHQDLLTFVLVGAGPTGVELSAALAVLVRSMLKTEFRRIDPAIARVVLVDMAPRVLALLLRNSLRQPNTG